MAGVPFLALRMCRVAVLKSTCSPRVGPFCASNFAKDESNASRMFRTSSLSVAKCALYPTALPHSYTEPRVQ